MKGIEGKSSKIATETTVGEIVSRDYRTAEVFERYGIDFCCGGKVTLADICREKQIPVAVITSELESLWKEPPDLSQDYSSWELPFLADYIINIHHRYLKEHNEQIVAYANKIASVHGARHPEVVRIAAIFDKIVTDMAGHLREEEEVLFPALARVVAARKAGLLPERRDSEAIQNSLPRLYREHEEIGDAVHEIRRLAGGYSIPNDVCNTFVITYRKLREFEDDLHKHVHLENNILFPKALKL